MSLILFSSNIVPVGLSGLGRQISFSFCVAVQSFCFCRVGCIFVSSCFPLALNSPVRGGLSEMGRIQSEWLVQLGSNGDVSACLVLYRQRILPLPSDNLFATSKPSNGLPVNASNAARPAASAQFPMTSQAAPNYQPTGVGSHAAQGFPHSSSFNSLQQATNTQPFPT